MTQQRASIGVAIGAAAAMLAAQAAFLAAEPKAPWSGITIAVIAVALVAIGFAAGWRGILVAVAVTAASLVGWYLASDAGFAEAVGDCDPSCGISLGGALVLALPVVLALAGLGTALRRLTGKRG
jgi:hypothetical protein